MNNSMLLVVGGKKKLATFADLKKLYLSMSKNFWLLENFFLIKYRCGLILFCICILELEGKLFRGRISFNLIYFVKENCFYSL